MIFQPELVELILAGRKTQTRRLAGINDCRYQVGRDYAVQPGRGKKGVARVLVTAVRRETEGDISLADARAEGFKNRTEFRRYWTALYGRPSVPGRRVWVISFELVRPS